MIGEEAGRKQFMDRCVVELSASTPMAGTRTQTAMERPI
jgi:hypothetical protein